MKKLVTKAVGSFINLTALLFPKWNANYSFNLLCKVKRVGVSRKWQEFLDDSETTYLSIEGHSAALHKKGTGDKKLLFLHGWMSNSQRWLPYINRLNLDVFTIYALDAPGHGMAKGEHLNVEIYRLALMQSLELIGEVDTLVCHSLGSLVGSYGYLNKKDIPVKSFIIMGSPSGMDAIFIYFRELLGLSQRAMNNLEIKINGILKIPHAEVSVANFFQQVKSPVLVIHDFTDKITPIEPIKVASEKNQKIQSFFTTGQDHNLKGEDTINKVIEFINYKKCI